MEKCFAKVSIEQRIHWLNNQLDIALNSRLLTFEELMKINEMGIYIVFNADDILYVGKTERAGKIRLRELVSDFRSHTFNKKMLIEHFYSLGYNIPRLNRNSKTKLIEDLILDVEQFKAAQKAVNAQIKELKFKFHETRNVELTNIEHFAISVLKPLFND